MNPKPINVGIVDDHELFRIGVKKHLQDHPEIDVILDVPDGTQLIPLLQKLKTKPSILLVDIRMPRMNGYNTTLVVKERWPNIKVIALSMYDQEYPVINMLLNGASGYVSKNDNAEELRNAVINVAKHGRYHSNRVVSYLTDLNGGLKKSKVDLTDREKEFLCNCCSDKTYREIAKLMNIGYRSVENYRESLFKKLNVKNRIGLAVFAIESGLHPLK